MGLAIAKAIVEAHGGGIEVASQVGRETVSTFSLPIERAKPKICVLTPIRLQLELNGSGQRHHSQA